MATASARQITIGPVKNGYLYTEVTPELWKCQKAAIGWEAPEGFVLWLVKHQGMWMAFHASRTCTTTAEVVRENPSSLALGKQMSPLLAPTSGMCGTQRAIVEGAWSWHLLGFWRKN